MLCMLVERVGLWDIQMGQREAMVVARCAVSVKGVLVDASLGAFCGVAGGSAELVGVKVEGWFA